MTPVEYQEHFAACSAWIKARDILLDGGTRPEDLDAAAIGALWRALEIASGDMSKDALKRLIFGEQPAPQPLTVPEALVKWAYSPELVETGNHWQQGYEHARAWVHVQLSCNDIGEQP